MNQLLFTWITRGYCPRLQGEMLAYIFKTIVSCRQLCNILSKYCQTDIFLSTALNNDEYTKRTLEAVKSRDRLCHVVKWHSVREKDSESFSKCISEKKTRNKQTCLLNKQVLLRGNKKGSCGETRLSTPRSDTTASKRTNLLEKIKQIMGEQLLQWQSGLVLQY